MLVRVSFIASSPRHKMTEPKPTVYHLFGDDRFAMESFLQTLSAKLGDEITREMNTSRFAAPNVDLAALEEDSLAAPFLASRRLVIVDNAERLLEGRDDSAWERFEAFLLRLPETTALVLLEMVQPPKGRRRPKPTRLQAWSQAHPERAYAREMWRPQGPAFARWISQRCADLGGEIENQAASLLAAWVSEDAALADQELQKLLAFVDRSRPIQVQDVERLTPFHGQANIFALVDALAERRSAEAQRLLHLFLQEEQPGYAFAMIVRQFRLLLLAKESQRLGRPLKDAISLPDFVLQKLAAQARLFSEQDLIRTYHRLLDLDLSDKRSLMPLEVGLDAFLAAITPSR